MFVTISSLGQTFLFETNLSFIVSLFMFLFTLIIIKKVPTKIGLAYSILFIYTFILSIYGKDLYSFCISLGTILFINIFANTRFKEKSIYIGSIIMSLFSLGVLFLYNRGIVLSNWNPNSITMFCTYGMIAVLIPIKCYKNAAAKIIGILIVCSSIYCISSADCRNNILIFLVAILSIFVFDKAIKSKMLYRVYYSVILFLPMIIPKAVDIIQKYQDNSFIKQISVDIFSKGSIFSDRDVIWNNCKWLCRDNSMFGFGKSLYEFLYAHNLFFSVQYSYGIVGYILYIFLIVVILEYVLNKEDEIGLKKVCLNIFLAIFVGQIMENALFTSNLCIFVPYIYLSMAIYVSEKYKKGGNSL